MRQWFMENLWYVDGPLSIVNIIKLWSADNIFQLVSVLFTTSKPYVLKVCWYHSVAVLCYELP